MISEKAKLKIVQAFREELQTAIAEHGKFNSNHEAWAVLNEEIEEVYEESEKFLVSTRVSKSRLWDGVKQDMPDEKYLTGIYNRALDLACECVQVAAMVSKWEMFLDGEV